MKKIICDDNTVWFCSPFGTFDWVCHYNESDCTFSRMISSNATEGAYSFDVTYAVASDIDRVSADKILSVDDPRLIRNAIHAVWVNHDTNLRDLVSAVQPFPDKKYRARRAVRKLYGICDAAVPATEATKDFRNYMYTVSKHFSDAQKYLDDVREADEEPTAMIPAWIHLLRKGTFYGNMRTSAFSWRRR